MKQIFTSISLFLLLGNAAIAQEKSNVEKISVKKETAKEPCFVSEFDANGKEVKVPCGTKSKTKITPTNSSVVTVDSEQDPATGYKKYFLHDFDEQGKEMKTYGNLVEEFNAAGKSMLFFKFKNAVGEEITRPAKLQ